MPSRTSSTGWAFSKCTSPATPSAGEPESSSRAAAGRDPWCCSVRQGPGGHSAASSYGQPGDGSPSARSAATRRAPPAHAIASNGLLRWSLLAGQVAHPNRIPPEELAAFIRAGSLAPVVAPLLREFPVRQVQPLPAVRDSPVRLVWADRDRVLPFDDFGAPMLERLPGAELIRLHGVGHVPMSDDPITVAKLILEATRAGDKAAGAT